MHLLIINFLRGIFAGTFLGKFLTIMFGYLVVKLLATAGIVIITYTGIDYIFTTFENAVFSTLGTIPSVIYEMLEMYGAIFYIEMILAAMSAILAIKSLTAFKRVVFK